MQDYIKSSNNAVEYSKFAGVIISIVAITALVATYISADGIDEWMRIFMGVFLATFSAFKFAGYKMFVLMFRGYDLIAKQSKLYSAAYPFIEMLLGLAFLLNVFPVARNILVILVMGIGAIGVFQEIYHRRKGAYCACLGNIIKLPLSTVSLVEDITMMVMASVMLLMLG